jgi:hypothetical protein
MSIACLASLNDNFDVNLHSHCSALKFGTLFSNSSCQSPYTLCVEFFVYHVLRTIHSIRTVLTDEYILRYALYALLLHC